MSFHDSWGSVGPSQPPSICPLCEIPILPGTDHTGSIMGHIEALKQFIRLCQDDIENSRMRDFQHPTREELLSQIQYLSEQFDKFVIYVTSMRDHIAEASRGKLVP